MTQLHVIGPQPARPEFSVSDIERLVHTFYARVREHESLEPVFARRVTDWPYHLDRMVGFWRSVLRGEPTFQASPRGNPPKLHWSIEELEHRHFTEWLALFGEVAEEVFPAEHAEYLRSRAARIAVTLSRHAKGPRSSSAS
ncbi:hypothetical protein ABI59_09020 [Acidobacteria bacterium Mor1]|nr:hypothetical protein ABI59_09020 [Acidobacteria bacterium Mor1]